VWRGQGQRAHEGTHEWLQLRYGVILDSALLASGDWLVRAYRPADVGLRYEVACGPGLALPGSGV
jgi:hypothetical protein